MYIISLIKIKHLGRTDLVKRPQLSFFPGVDSPRIIYGSFWKDYRSWMLWGKINLIHGTEESIFRKGVCFCFLFVLFFCLPELFSFISLPVFPLLKSSLSSKPIINEYRGSVLSWAKLSKTNWLKIIRPSSVILSNILIKTILIPTVFLFSVESRT